VIVWMWDADGPDRAVGGVTDNEERARRAVEALMLSGQTTAARVEKAHLVTGFGALTSHYQRMGEGWTAHRHRGKVAVTWLPFEAGIPA
jgi:hypothetical protein